MPFYQSKNVGILAQEKEEEKIGAFLLSFFFLSEPFFLCGEKS